MNTPPTLTRTKKPAASHMSGGTVGSYIVGYVLSLILTLTAYVLIVNHVFTKWIMVATVGWLALLQFMVQLLFFLHLDNEAKPRFKLLAFALMLVFVLILVVGSVWIMNNLNYRMDHEQLMHYLHDQDGGI